jgi:hypothetical protein
MDQMYALVVVDTALADARWPEDAPHRIGQARSMGSVITPDPDRSRNGIEAIPISHQPEAGERWDAVTRTVIKPTGAEIAAELEARYNALGEQIATLRGIPITTLSVGEVGRRP